MRPGQERTLLVEVAVGIGRIAGGFDPDRVAATRGEQSRRLDEAFRRGPAISRIGAVPAPAGTESGTVASSASVSATVRAATSCVRKFGT